MFGYRGTRGRYRPHLHLYRTFRCFFDDPGGDRTEPTPGSAREAYLHIRSVVADLPQSSFRTTLQAFLRVSEAEVESFKESVEGWFEATMGEVSNWYKQRSQAVVIVLHRGGGGPEL